MAIETGTRQYFELERISEQRRIEKLRAEGHVIEVDAHGNFNAATIPGTPQYKLAQSFKEMDKSQAECNAALQALKRALSRGIF